MSELYAVFKRNNKLFFKDKGMFFTSLITPLILLVLYATFLGKIYTDSFLAAFPEGIIVDQKIIDGIVGGQLISSLLAVSCISVAFCSNLLMVQDKVTGAYRDLAVTPVKSSVLSVGYFFSSAFVTLLICLCALFAGLVYIALIGWYLSIADVLLLILDCILLVLFGTALSSIINCTLTTNGQASAVGTIVSSGYGFICGAYMPIANFPDVLQKIVAFLPGTYGTSLLRNHAMRGAFAEMEVLGYPEEVLAGMQGAVDYTLSFFGTPVSVDTMLVILSGSALLLTICYVFLARARQKGRK